MRKICVLLTAVFLCAALGGCGLLESDALSGLMGLIGSSGPGAEEILELYSGYTVMDGKTNKAGISVGKVELSGDYYVINIRSSHPIINQDEGNVGVIANRLSVLDAEDPDTELDFGLLSVSSTTTKPDGTSTHEYYPAIRIAKSEKAKFVLVMFDGIDADEVAELETLPLFFVVELNRKEPKLLTEKPLAAGKLLG